MTDKDMPPPPDAPHQAVDQALVDHQNRCGCILPVNRMPRPQPLGDDKQLFISTPRTTFGFFPFPMEQPSNRQNRTTQSPGFRTRHPTNAIKPELITTSEARKQSSE